ncbi:MAG: LysM peptidoglycan-binding domain-containing protein [Gemmatimonadales bacterium]
MSRVPFLLLCVVLPACSSAPVRTGPQPSRDDAPTEVAAPNGIPVSRLPGSSGNAAPADGSLRIVADSLADTEVLDSIHDAAALDSVPELDLDVPSWDLSVEKFAAHPRVQYYVDFFAGRSHERFQVWLDRMPRFEGYARKQLAARDLPGDLVYLALIESGFSTVATSRASAVGMWQFMAPTGRAYGLRVDGWVDERRDPIKATDAAARHLADLTERFGSHYLAAAAYNGGAGRVGRGLTRMASGDDEFDQSSDDAFFELASTSLIYQETKDYVPKLIAAALIAKEPTKYQFREPASVAPFPHDSVIVDGGTGLDLIARLADTTLDAMRELNPHLLRMVTPPGRTYAVRLPDGRAVMVARRYADVPARERAAVATHRVAKGETVTTIARRYGVGAPAIRAANSNARGKRLAVGSTLYIPVSKVLPESVLREPEAVTNSRSRTHLVRRGETLSGIASRYGVTQASIRTANKLPKRGAVRIGQSLVIRGATGGVSKRSSVARASAKTHVVKPGETVGSIAQRYGVKQSTLISVNRLGKRAVIRTGQRLRIPV